MFGSQEDTRETTSTAASRNMGLSGNHESVGTQLCWTQHFESCTGRWEYCDKHNVIQGPFTNKQMSDWHKAGFFPETLPVRLVGENEFKSLGKLLEGATAGTDLFKTSHDSLQAGEEGVHTMRDAKQLQQWRSAVYALRYCIHAGWRVCQCCSLFVSLPGKMIVKFHQKELFRSSARKQSVQYYKMVNS